MVNFPEEIISVLTSYAEFAEEAAHRADDGECVAAFHRAIDHGATERQINNLLAMDDDEQEEIFGYVLLPEDTRIMIRELSDTSHQQQAWV